MLCLYTDSWMVANALWGWLQQWKRSNWQRRGKPIWAAPLWQDIAARLEKLVVKVRHVDAHIPKSQATEEHQNNQQVDQAAQIEVAQVDLDWQHKVQIHLSHFSLSSLIHLLVVLMFLSGLTLGYVGIHMTHFHDQLL
ncbi:ribonuclease H-like [Grus japonensis]|uniref:Ribonuclease H-like n=1 Tax=Grus japonensis TaxID=30415 RepID=A0ABC9YEM0_GRUJA